MLRLLPAVRSSWYVHSCTRLSCSVVAGHAVTCQAHAWSHQRNQQQRSVEQYAASSCHLAIPRHPIRYVRYLQMLLRCPRAAAAAAAGSRRLCRTPAAMQPAAQAQHHQPGSSSSSLLSWSCPGQRLAAAAGPCQQRRHLPGCSHPAGGPY
jgi:hypothetical protein